MSANGKEQQMESVRYYVVSELHYISFTTFQSEIKKNK